MLHILKRHLKTEGAMHKWGSCRFSPSNDHYLYNIAGLIKENPLPSATHVPASASDANRIGKQDLSPPFTFCSVQPLDIILSSIPLACRIHHLTLLVFTFSSLGDHPGIIFLIVVLSKSYWMSVLFSHPHCPLKRLQLKEMDSEQFKPD